MFIAMNRFRIAPGFEDGFEELWRRRDSYLDDVAGFREFQLLRGPSTDEETLYASHTGFMKPRSPSGNTPSRWPLLRSSRASALAAYAAPTFR